jgi:hypothetical protein
MWSGLKHLKESDMGYRSEVAYVIGFNNKEVLSEFIALVMLKGGEFRKALSECEIKIQDNGSEECFINFYQREVKWYDSFPDVQAHTWLYKYAVERFPDDASYKFLRIGEEQGDIEDDCEDSVIDLSGDFFTYTSMEIPFAHDYEPIGDKLGLLEPVETGQ